MEVRGKNRAINKSATLYRKSGADIDSEKRLVLVAVESLNVNSVFLSEALEDAGLVKLLTTTEFLNNTGLFKLSLELLEGAFDVFAFLNGYYNHLMCKIEL